MGVLVGRAASWVGRLVLGIGVAGAAAAAQIDINGPSGSVSFGQQVRVLPNGNIVVTDPNGFASGVGAVYLYRPDRTLISTLTGSAPNDRIGNFGVVVLGSGNFLVLSSSWNNGAIARVGAVTWVDGNLGLNGVVSPANSLIGTTQGDGSELKAIALANGNAAVHWAGWHKAGVRVGAVTWCGGSAACVGTVSAGNSLVGSVADDLNVVGLTPLSNGNFVVGAKNWTNASATNAGAVTWMDGSGRTVVGPVNATNSLVGTTTNDYVGEVVLGLSNGNYVVGSPDWDNGSTVDVGAATWADGSTAGPRRTGPVSTSNSLYGGSTANNAVGGKLMALTNGNYVVGSYNWNNNAGAATWADGTTGRTGTVTLFNSLIGSQSGDLIGAYMVPLSNGHYVVHSYSWHDGANANVGAVTWGNGNSGRIGTVSAANSLVGSNAGDNVGWNVTALANGHYVSCAPTWRNGTTSFAGAATWGNGNTAGPRTVGAVSAANSLTSGATDTFVCRGGVTALDDGNYVVNTPDWNNGLGAATWVDGGAEFSGTVSVLNSLRGTQSGDTENSDIVALRGGDWLMLSSLWTGSGSMNRGAITRVHGSFAGAITTNNSLVGGTASDQLGNGGATVFADGTYVVRSGLWDNGALGDAGAITIGEHGAPLIGTVTNTNSVRNGVQGAGAQNSVSYDAARKRIAVGRLFENKVTLFLLDGLFADGFEL